VATAPDPGAKKQGQKHSPATARSKLGQQAVTTVTKQTEPLLQVSDRPHRMHQQNGGSCGAAYFLIWRAEKADTAITSITSMAQVHIQKLFHPLLRKPDISFSGSCIQ